MSDNAERAPPEAPGMSGSASRSTAPEPRITAANARGTRRPGLRRSLAAQWSLTIGILVALAAALAVLALRYATDSPLAATAIALLVMVPVVLLVVRAQLANPLAIFRALGGTVTSYRDRDFAFGLHWPRNDEIGDLVEAHNELGAVLRAQRLDLVQRELLLDTMVQHTPVAMLLVAERGAIVFSNIAARQLLNDGRRLEGHSLDDLLSRASASLREAIARGGDGLFTVDQNGMGSGSGTGKQSGNNGGAPSEPDAAPRKIDPDPISGAANDDAEIYHLARRSYSLNGREHELFLLRHLTVELRRQEVQTWKKVIRVISHELNNSLAPIASLAHSATELLRRDKPERLPEILATIAERSRHLQTFIDGYAKFAKLPAPRREPTAWPDFVAALQGQIAFGIAGKLPTEPAAFDRGQLEQALLNLLKNAHESGSSADAIALGVRRLPDGFAIEVCDRGPGMTETVMSNALVPFYSTKRSGTGLGLALAREIVEAHGGRITINNREGGGLSVVLLLPAG